MIAAIRKSETIVPLIRHPKPEDGRKIWQLVRDTQILDLNSVYCYLLLCSHFRETCIIAETDNELSGFITAYITPEDETTLFIWQIGIAEHARNQGLAKHMILDLLQKDICRNIRQIQATVSPSNIASLALFRSLARKLDTGFEQKEYFSASLFPEELRHEKEMLITVGQF